MTDTADQDGRVDPKRADLPRADIEPVRRPEPGPDRSAPETRRTLVKRSDSTDRADTETGGISGSPSRDDSWAGDDAGRPAALRMAGAGLELAGSTLVMAGLGYAIDAARGHATPYAAIAGTLVGFSLGMYRLIAMAMKTLDD